jgi:hypothetical protein
LRSARPPYGDLAAVDVDGVSWRRRIAERGPFVIHLQRSTGAEAEVQGAYLPSQCDDDDREHHDDRP